MDAMITFHVLANGYLLASLRRRGMEFGPMGSDKAMAQGSGPTIADALRDLTVQMSKNDPAA